MKKCFAPNPVVMRQLRSGPLATSLDGFADLLVRQGYSSPAGWKKIRLVADLSRWLARQRLKIDQLDEQQTARFLETWWKRHSRQSGDKSTPQLLLRLLRQLGVIPDPTAPCGAIDFIQRDYGYFLIHERGFTPGSVARCMPVARRFLSDRFPDEQIRLPKLCEKDVPDFVMRDTVVRGRRSAQLMTTLLRSFLSCLTRAEAEALLAAPNRGSWSGRRDQTLLLLTLQTGLRVSEVVGLRF